MNKKEKTTIAVIVLGQMAMIVLRLGRVIDWHWAWVLSPALLIAGLFTVAVFLAFVITGYQELFG